MNWKLSRIQSHIDRCLRDSLVFSRKTIGGNLVEVEVFRHDQAEWLVIAAGISESEARRFFPQTSSRAERAMIPFSITGAGNGAMLFVVRPHESGLVNSCVASFSSDIPFIELFAGYFRLLDVDNETVRHLRWEWDSQASRDEPIETWLVSWKSVLGFNPAHAPSHLHLNSPPLVTTKRGRARKEPAANELRLAVGVPNPLAFLLSIAVWLRSP